MLIFYKLMCKKVSSNESSALFKYLQQYKCITIPPIFAKSSLQSLGINENLSTYSPHAF